MKGIDKFVVVMAFVVPISFSIIKAQITLADSFELGVSSAVVTMTVITAWIVLRLSIKGITKIRRKKNETGKEAKTIEWQDGTFG